MKRTIPAQNFRALVYIAENPLPSHSASFILRPVLEESRINRNKHSLAGSIAAMRMREKSNPGTERLVNQSGVQLGCVQYCYCGVQGKRWKTVKGVL